MMKLLERFVVAFEKIAENGSNIYSENATPPTPTPTPTPIVDIERDYDTIASKYDGREVLLQLCENRGINVQPKTRTTTLVKMLNASDVVEKDKDTEPETIIEEVIDTEPETIIEEDKNTEPETAVDESNKFGWEEGDEFAWEEGDEWLE